MDWGPIWDFVTMLAVGAGGFALVYFRHAAQTATDEAVKEAAARINFPRQLARELATLRGTQRQELRYQAYGKLWHRLRRLAIYDEDSFDKAAASELSNELSDWYFEETGGMLLSGSAREAYFALQDLLQATVRIDANWSARRFDESGEGYRGEVMKLLGKLRSDKARRARLAYEQMPSIEIETWEQAAPVLAAAWRAGLNEVAERWSQLGETQRFAVLQQAGSVLRTFLANDLESRER
jgi:hypothetical protein